MLQLELRPVWVPRDLNMVADVVSKFRDTENFAVTPDFFKVICADFAIQPDFDCFADSITACCTLFFRLTHCLGSAGVDAFLQDWSTCGVCWIFPAPRLIIRALRQIVTCRGKGIFLIPQWKNNAFYTVFRRYCASPYFVKKLVYNGAGCFLAGSDPTSHFGPNYSGNVECIYFDFTI